VSPLYCLVIIGRGIRGTKPVSDCLKVVAYVQFFKHELRLTNDIRVSATPFPTAKNIIMHSPEGVILKLALRNHLVHSRCSLHVLAIHRFK
jgi:hypothetical protein